MVNFYFIISGIKTMYSCNNDKIYGFFRLLQKLYKHHEIYLPFMNYFKVHI